MNPALEPMAATQHLTADNWESVTFAWIAKAISELSHELLLSPSPSCAEVDGWASYRLSADDPATEYRFRARRLALDHWLVERRSIQRWVGGQQCTIDALRFVADLRDTLRIPPAALGEYLEEVSRTLSGAAFKRLRPTAKARELANSDFQDIETAMSEGHPSFLANNARLGFNALDYRKYAPEVGKPLRLIWVAGLASRSCVASLQGVSYEALLESELGPATLASFKQLLVARGLEPSAYVMMPVHPWQWNDRIVQLFAADLARGELVLLGEGRDEYQPQQSIRTAFNDSSPEKHYVKTALSILNMGFTRGMSAGLGPRVAAVNDWVKELVSSDSVLRELGFDVLREVAFVGYRHRYFEQTSARRYDPYRETLAALWRESPIARVSDGERLMTMAALLHVDAAGTSLLAELIDASGLPAADWLRAYLRAYLSPLLHCFYAYQLTFTPHCENVILVLEDGVPKRVFMKDIAEDIGVLNPTSELPEGVKHLALRVPEEVMTLVIFTDAFDCVFRFLGQIVEEHGICRQDTLWREVAECVLSYERQHPELSEKFARHDLFAETFLRNCLNRLQLKNNRLMVDLNADEPGDSLQFVGTLPNPIAPFSPRRPLRGGQS